MMSDQLPVLQQDGRKVQRLPVWLKKKLGPAPVMHKMKAALRQRGLHTVCEEASCPNIGECWAAGTATLMILGDICTRHCGFCDVQAGSPRPVDPDEPEQLARMVAALDLKHVVITCVARDDLADRGASQFARCVEAVRSECPATRIELLTTDFSLLDEAISVVLEARPDIWNHNIETVARLTDKVRHRARYEDTLKFFRIIKQRRPEQKTKSGLMLGLGETHDEIMVTLQDLREVGCDMLTIGQYLRPAKRNLPVAAYVEPVRFEQYGQVARELGFEAVASGPFVRSSYHAEEMLR